MVIEHQQQLIKTIKTPKFSFLGGICVGSPLPDFWLVDLKPASNLGQQLDGEAVQVGEDGVGCVRIKPWGGGEINSASTLSCPFCLESGRGKN